MKIYQQIASSLAAMHNCRKSGNTEWEEKHKECILDIVKNRLPSGSGWDIGTKFDFMVSTSDKLVFEGSYHHMDDAGGYDGWTDHAIIVTPSLAFGFNLKIIGSNKNDIKEYLSDIFHSVLMEKV